MLLLNSDCKAEQHFVLRIISETIKLTIVVITVIQWIRFGRIADDYLEQE